MARPGLKMEKHSSLSSPGSMTPSSGFVGVRRISKVLSPAQSTLISSKLAQRALTNLHIDQNELVSDLNNSLATFMRFFLGKEHENQEKYASLLETIAECTSSFRTKTKKESFFLDGSGELEKIVMHPLTQKIQKEIQPEKFKESLDFSSKFISWFYYLVRTPFPFHCDPSLLPDSEEIDFEAHGAL